MSVLRGGSQTLGDPHLLAVIMETDGSGARYGVSDEELHAEMRGHGLAPYGYEPFGRSLIEASQSNGIRCSFASGQRLSA